MTVGFAVIGSGLMGHSYAGTVRDLTTGTRLAVVAGGTRSQSIAAQYGAAWEASVEEAIGRPDVDAVILATPHSLHLPHALLAASLGKHVYVEKPMARSVAECDAMIDACRAAGVQLAVNKVLRFRAATMAGRQAIEDGTIGELRMMFARLITTEFLEPEKPWSADPTEGSQWLAWGVHCTDLFRWYTGSDATTAHASYASYSASGPAGQTAAVEYVFGSGVIGRALMSYEFPEPGLMPSNTVLLVGSKAMLDVDMWGRVRLGTGRGWRTIATQPAIDYVAGYMHPNRLLGFAAQVQDFAEAIETDREPVIGGAEGRAAVEMVEAADRSAATGQTVRLPL